MATEQINLFPDGEEKIDLFKEQPLQLPLELATQRATKASFGLAGQYSVDPNSLAVQISQGNERRMREQAAREQNLNFRKAKHQMIREEMAKRDGDMSFQEVQFYLGLSEEHVANPDTIFESEYAEKFLQTALTINDEGNALREALDEDPEKAMEVMDQAGWVLKRKEIAQTILEDLEEEYKNSGMVRKIEDTVEMFVPFLSAARQGQLPLLQDFDARKDELLLMPPDQFYAELKKDVEDIKEHSFQDAMVYVNNVLTESTSDKVFDNLWLGLDIADVATLGVGGALVKGSKGLVKAGKAAPRGVSRLAHTIKEAVKAGATRDLRPEDVSAAVGDLERSAITSTLSEWREKLLGMDPTMKGKNVYKHLGSILNPFHMMKGASRLAAPMVHRLGMELERNAAKLIQAVTEPGAAVRLGDNALLRAAENAMKALKNKYDHLNDVVLDVYPSFQFDKLTNTYSANIQLGKGHGVLFDSEKEAAIVGRDLYELDPGSFRVLPQGDKYFINISRDIDETQGVVRDELVIDKNEKTPDDFFNSIFGYVRSPEDVLSELNRENRHAVTHGMQEVLNLVNQASKSIGKLGFFQKRRLNRVLQENRDAMRDVPLSDGTNKTVRGRYWRTVGEFERGFYEVTGHFPSFKETKAYFTMRQINDFAYMMLNYSLYRDKSRMGIAQYRFKFQRVGDDGQVTLADSRYFEGKEVDKLPEDNIDDGIAIYNSESGKTTYFRRLHKSPDELNYLNEVLADKSYKMIQIANPMDKPLAEQLGVPDTINFLVVRDYESKALDHAQINYRPGGPVIYSDERFIKQGRVRETTYGTNEYEGDVSIMSFSNDAKANKYVALLNKAREMLKAEKEGSFDKTKGGAAAIRYKGKVYRGKTHAEAAEKIVDELKQSLPPKEIKPSQSMAAFRIKGKTYFAEEHSAALMKAVHDLGEEVVEKEFNTSILSVVEDSRAAGDMFGYVDEDGQNFIPSDQLWEQYNKADKYEQASNEIDAVMRGEGEDGFISGRGKFVTRKEAEAIVTPRFPEAGVHNMDARSHYTDKSALDKFIEDNLPVPPAKFRSWFEPELDEVGNAVRPARLSLDVPMVVVKSKQQTNDIPKVLDYRKFYEEGKFEDTWDHPRNLYREINKKHTGEREPNLDSVSEGMHEGKPLIRIKEPRLLDPMQSMKKLVSHFMRSRFMDDYEIYAMENFIQEFGHLMTAPIEELRQNPMLALKRPQWRADADFDELQAARSARIAIMNLLGTPGVTQGLIDSLKHKLLSSIYTKVGDWQADWVADRLLPTLTDPFSYARSIAFHTKLGLFNPVQLFLQAQTFAHIIALSPTHAGQAWSAAWLMRRLKMAGHDAIPQHFAKIASKMGWTEEEFIESFNELRKTGLWHVEGEQAFRDDVFEPAVFQGAFRKALDTGLFFFREAERGVRMTAWNVAYREWKRANPGRKIGNRERNAILRRANDLGVNMTRASNASWQQGVFSIPAQFLGYQVRLMEQFLGKRLTTAEKVRAFWMYSALYGVPTAIGAQIGLWPVYETIKGAALEKGMDVDDKKLEIFLDGIPAVALEVLGLGDQNFSERYGPGGLRILKEIARGEKGLVEIAVGASGSILADIIQSADPTFKAIYNVFTDDPNSEYPIMLEDVIDQTRNISTINNFAKAFYAMNTGKYFTQNEIYLEDVNAWDTFFMSMTGTTPQSVTDTFLMIESMQDVEKVQREAKKYIIRYLRRGYQAVADNNHEAAEAAFRAARVHWIGAAFRDDQATDILNEAFNGHTSLVDKVRDDFFLKKAPADQVEERTKRYMETFGAQ